MIEVVSAIITSTAYALYNGGPDAMPSPRRVLLTQRKREKHFPFTWECPGGKVEPGETHLEALHRELYEELGIAVALEAPMVWRCEYEPGKPITFYLVTRFSPMPYAQEGQGMGWFLPNEMKCLSLSPGNELAAGVILSHLSFAVEHLHGERAEASR